MARLFITPREVDLISDLTKEVMKDVIGQKIYYYRIREDLTEIHDVYEEAVNKIFDPPIDIDATIEWNSPVVTTGRFGVGKNQEIGAYLHYRDLIDKGIDVREGDYFSYGEVFFEITQLQWQSTIYGEVEHTTGVKLQGKQARKGLINKEPIGPTDEAYYPGDPKAVQEVFVQQRGFAENRLGPTGDVRALIEQGKMQLPPTPAPAEVSKRVPPNEPTPITSRFYDET